MSLKAEQIAHINTVNWFHDKYPEYADDFHHFANERKCSYNEGRTLKKMGVKKGVADLHLAIARGGFHGLWIELKVGRGNISPEQQAFIDQKNRRGYLALVVWEHEGAKAIISSYMDGQITYCKPNAPINCS